MDVEPNTTPTQATLPHGGTVRLVTLGRLALLQPSGEELPLLGHKRKLALLAVLALSPAVSREELMAMFWADDKDERSRRHSLSNALSFLRRLLGGDSIATHRADVTLAPDAVEVDAVALLSAKRTNDHARVMDLYEGPFLDGVSVPGSTRFDSWVDTQRAAIERAVFRAKDAPKDAPRAASGNSHGAAQLAPETEQHSLPFPAAGADREKRTDPNGFPLTRRVLIAVAWLATIVAIAAYALLRYNPVVPTRPLIAVTDIVNVQGDTASVWLEDGL